MSRGSIITTIPLLISLKSTSGNGMIEIDRMLVIDHNPLIFILIGYYDTVLFNNVDNIKS